MLRFRPILMTTMAALFGAVPLAIGTGMGSELRRPLGISIIGGLIVSQASDAVHHAGDLSIHGQSAAEAARRQACQTAHGTEAH